MDSTAWNQRYKDSELVWSAAPNIWVKQLTQDLPAGKALDIAAGEGRNALWLASRGWHVTAVDFSTVALQRARSLAEEQLGRDVQSRAGRQILGQLLDPHVRCGGPDKLAVLVSLVPCCAVHVRSLREGV